MLIQKRNFQIAITNNTATIYPKAFPALIRIGKAVKAHLVLTVNGQAVDYHLSTVPQAFRPLAVQVASALQDYVIATVDNDPTADPEKMLTDFFTAYKF